MWPASPGPLAVHHQRDKHDRPQLLIFDSAGADDPAALLPGNTGGFAAELRNDLHDVDHLDAISLGHPRRRPPARRRPRHRRLLRPVRGRDTSDCSLPAITGPSVTTGDTSGHVLRHKLVTREILLAPRFLLKPRRCRQGFHSATPRKTEIPMSSVPAVTHHLSLFAVICGAIGMTFETRGTV
jgi:hypothetical protein